MRLAQSSVAYGGADRTWLVSALEGQDNNLPVTLDLSLFPTGTSAGQFSSGGLNASEVIVKAGCALGIVTATGKAGPYDDAASDGRQTCVGLLLNDVAGASGTAAQFQTDAAVRMGAVYTDRLPYSSGIGSLDAAGKVDLKLVDFRVRGTL